MDSTISGGQKNRTKKRGSTVGGGRKDRAINRWATVAGGDQNIASGPRSTIGGGVSNIAAVDYSFAAGREAKANNQAPSWGPTRPSVLEAVSVLGR